MKKNESDKVGQERRTDEKNGDEEDEDGLGRKEWQLMPHKRHSPKAVNRKEPHDQGPYPHKREHIGHQTTNK